MFSRHAPPLSAVALVLTLAACTGGGPATSPPPAAAGQPAAAAPAAPPSPPTVLTLGIVAAVGYPFYIGIERGYYREQGIDLQIELVRTGTDMVPMIAQGQLDISQQAVSPATFNALLRGVAMKAIVDASHSDPGQRSHAAMVRTELWESGAVRTMSDLVGRRVGSGTPPVGPSIAVDRALRRAGHRIQEFDLVQLSQPDMPAALNNGSIDGAVVFEPAISATLGLNAGVVVGWLADEYPGQAIAVQVIGTSLIDRPDLARRFTLGYVRGARDYTDTIKHKVGVEEMAALLTPYNGLDVGLNADLLRRHGLTSIDPDGRINKESMAYDLGWYIETGQVERTVDLDKFVDMQYADWAVAQLGPYAPPRRQ
jgi:NitT/TauT family transport system substrate-binding protein